MAEAAGPSAGAADLTTMAEENPQSKLIQKEVTMTPLKAKLLETLGELSYMELEHFKWLLRQTEMKKGLPRVSRQRMAMAERDEIVELMMKAYGQQSVEVTTEVFKKMNRTDLVQKLSEIISGSKDKCWDEATFREVTMTSLKGKLLDTLEELSYMELEHFKQLLQQTEKKKGLRRISRQLMKMADRDEIVELIVKTYGQQSVEVTTEALMMMNRRDLVQNLSEISSGSKVKPQSKLIQKEVAMTMSSTMTEEKLLETMEELRYGELQHFKQLLQDTVMKKGLPRISRQRMKMADTDEIVELIVKTYGQQSVEVTTEALMMMNRTDLVQKLSEISSGSKEKPQSKLIQKEVTMTSLKEKLLETLEDLNYVELEHFKQFLQDTEMKKDLPRISRQRMEMADKVALVKLMVKTYGQQSVEVTMEVFNEMNRTDLVQKLSEIISGSKEKPQCKPIHEQDSSDWTELEPEVNSTDADEAPTYSLQSEAGNFECSVSGLRWVCKKKVSFKYQFCSLKRHMERIESMQYMPAGPLMDITVIAGKLDEVYLPHWICIDDNPTILDKFAVLHIDDCGDVVEKVSEVTSSHVKLSEPAFSLKLVLVKAGFSVEINSKVLIYGTKTPFFKLRVYLIPPDPGLLKDLEKTESSDGYRRFKKPHPKKPLKMHDWFILTAELGGAEIYSDTLQLLYESTEPNFYEVVIKDPVADLTLKLGKENESQPVWTCVIPQGEYQSTDGPIQVKATCGQSSKPGPSDSELFSCHWDLITAGPSAGAAAVTTMAEGEHFVDRHRDELIRRVDNVAPILDQLLSKKIIQQGVYDEIRAIANKQDKMRRLFGPLNAAGPAGKDVFYKILERHEPYLIDELKKKDLV